MMTLLAAGMAVLLWPASSVTSTEDCRRQAREVEREWGGSTDPNRLALARTRCWGQPEMGARELDQIERDRQFEALLPNSPAPDLTPRSDEWRGSDPLKFD